MIRPLLGVVLCVSVTAFADDKDPAPITPVEAIKKVGEKVTVEMKVRAAKNRLEKRGEV